MVRFTFQLAVVATLATAYASSAEDDSQKRGLTTPPSRDSFYDVPGEIDGLDPGTILDHREPPFSIGAFGWKSDSLEQSYQILYRTTDSLDNATATVMTVMVPKNASFDKIVSFQVAEDAATIDCAPSYGFQTPTQSDPLLASATMQVQLLLIEGALAKGWVVLVEDVAGPRGACGANQLAGQAVLDGIRAALKSGYITGIKQDAKTVMWGYSGGAGITRAAADLQPDYAPTLSIAGAAYGGAGATDPTASLQINNSPDAGLIPAALLGIANQYQEYADLISEHIKIEYRTMFYQALNQCLEGNLRVFDGHDILGMFDDYTVLFNSSIANKIFKDSRVESTPTIPIFWYQNVRDVIIPIDTIDTDVKEYCAKGANVRYQRNDAEGVNHQNYGLIGTTDVLTWFEGLFNGEVPESGCSTKTVDQTEIDPGFLSLFPKYIQSALLKFGNE